MTEENDSDGDNHDAILFAITSLVAQSCYDETSCDGGFFQSWYTNISFLSMDVSMFVIQELRNCELFLFPFSCCFFWSCCLFLFFCCHAGVLLHIYILFTSVFKDISFYQKEI